MKLDRICGYKYQITDKAKCRLRTPEDSSQSKERPGRRWKDGTENIVGMTSQRLAQCRDSLKNFKGTPCSSNVYVQAKGYIYYIQQNFKLAFSCSKTECGFYVLNIIRNTPAEEKI